VCNDVKKREPTLDFAGRGGEKSQRNCKAKTGGKRGAE